MKLTRREDLKISIWEDGNLVTTENDTIFGETEEDDIFMLIKTPTKEFKMKISKYAKIEPIEDPVEETDNEQEKEAE